MTQPKIAWNAIVKNEAGIIRRCLTSLLPHIDCGIVVDTGSTDDTPEIIRAAFAAADKPLVIGQAAFRDFSQARNHALARARASCLAFDYLLLADADMELKIDRPDWLSQLNGGLAYDMRQDGGGLTYLNRRLVNRKADGGYVGPTH